jgi:hypothetical protein
MTLILPEGFFCLDAAALVLEGLPPSVVIKKIHRWRRPHSLKAGFCAAAGNAPDLAAIAALAKIRFRMPR